MQKIGFIYGVEHRKKIEMLKFQALALRQNEWTPSTKVISETNSLIIFKQFVLIRRRHSFVPAKKRKCSNSGKFFNPGLQRMRGFFGLDLPSRNVLKKRITTTLTILGNGDECISV